MTASELPAAWRARAAELRPFGAEGAAAAFEGCARELEAVIGEAMEEELTLSQATRESGYSERRLRELLASGDIPNAGRKGRPRIRRIDLPKRPGREGGSFDAATEARTVLRAG